MEVCPIIAFSRDDWFGAWQTRQQILSRLPENGWPVVFSNGPLSFWDRGKPEWSDSGFFSGAKLSNNVLVDQPGKSFAQWPNHKLWNEISTRLHARHLRHIGRGIGGNKFITYIFHPSYADYVRQLNPNWVVFHADDNFEKTANQSSDLGKSINFLIERADLIIATTPEIANSLPGNAGSRARVLPNGVDFDTFAIDTDTPCPSDLDQVPYPRIGYVGRITPSADLHLIARLAKENMKWHWVFVGPVLLYGAALPEAENYAVSGLEACQACPNVHFLGMKKVEELPAYMAHMDINMMCYRADGQGWWEDGYPLKMHEYLAIGKPILSSPLKSVLPFSENIDIVRTDSDWKKAVDRALNHGGVGNIEQRRTIAKKNTWDSRAADLSKWLNETINS